MDGPLRWVVAILIVAAIIALVAFARGEPEHGEPDRVRRRRSSWTWSAEIVAADRHASRGSARD